MGLLSEQITDVVAFALPMSVGSKGSSLAASREVLVKWKSGWKDRFYQIYVNGVFAGITGDTESRQMVVQFPTSYKSSVRLEVFAIKDSEADTDFSDELEDSKGHSGRVRIGLLRQQTLPIGATADIFFDNGTGQIDMNEPINDERLQLWPELADKAGFGMSRFGFGDFGYDWSAAVGFGKGGFGASQFGSDADIFEWISGQLSAGIYKFAVKIFDKNGRESAASQEEEVVILPSARGIERLRIKSFNELSNELILSVE